MLYYHSSSASSLSSHALRSTLGILKGESALFKGGYREAACEPGEGQRLGSALDSFGPPVIGDRTKNHFISRCAACLNGGLDDGRFFVRAGLVHHHGPSQVR